MREHVAISLLGRRRVDRDILLRKERTMRDVVSLQILEELPGRFFFFFSIWLLRAAILDRSYRKEELGLTFRRRTWH